MPHSSGGGFVVRRDNPHATGGTEQCGIASTEFQRREGTGIEERVARLVGDGKRVLILSREAAALARMIETRNCRTIAVAVEGRRPSLDLDPGHWASSSPRETFEDE